VATPNAYKQILDVDYMLNKRSTNFSSSLSLKTDIFLTRHFSGRTLDYRQIFSIIVPIIVDQAFLVCMNLINTAMISSSGEAAVGAVNAIDSVNVFMVSIFIAVATGGSIVVAQYKGRSDTEMIPKAVAGSLVAVASISAVISVILLIFHNTVLHIYLGAADAAVYDNAKVYFVGCVASYFGIAIMEAICGAFRGIGETRSSLFLTISMNFIYVIGNFILINGFHMGTLGMAISINVARYTAAIAALIYLVKRNESIGFSIKHLVSIRFDMMKRIFSIGIPFASEQMFFNGGKILTQNMIVGLGAAALACNAIAASLISLYMIPAQALSLAVVTVVGQCIGNRDIAQAKKAIRSFAYLTAASFVLLSVILLPLYKPLVSLYHPDSKLVSEIFLILIITVVLEVFFWPGSFLVASALRAGGDSKYTSVMSMLSMWLFRVVLGYILGIYYKMGVLGFWIAMDFEWGVRSLLFLPRLRGKKWYAHKII